MIDIPNILGIKEVTFLNKEGEQRATAMLFELVEKAGFLDNCCALDPKFKKKFEEYQQLSPQEKDKLRLQIWGIK